MIRCRRATRVEKSRGLHATAKIEPNTIEENPQEGTWKDLKEDVSHHHWHEAIGDLRTAIDRYYQAGKTHVVNFLQKFGYRWVDGIIEPLPQTV